MSKVDEWKRKHAGEIDKAWDDLLRQPWGRQLLFEIIDSTTYCGAGRSTFHPNPSEQSYLNGQRDAGVRLQVAAQQANPELYARMIAEAMNSRRMLLIAQKTDAAEAVDAATADT